MGGLVWGPVCRVWTQSNYEGVRTRVSRVDTFKLWGHKNPYVAYGHIQNNQCASRTQRETKKSASVRAADASLLVGGCTLSDESVPPWKRHFLKTKKSREVVLTLWLAKDASSMRLHAQAWWLRNKEVKAESMLMEISNAADVSGGKLMVPNHWGMGYLRINANEHCTKM